jgi:heme/copper-type cytochrome/quinol oxidase subunit 2
MRTIRWGGAAALAAVLMVRGTAAADRPIHEIQITASRYAFEPVTIHVNAGEPVRVVIRSTDGLHGFSIPMLKIDVAVPKAAIRWRWNSRPRRRAATRLPVPNSAGAVTAT